MIPTSGTFKAVALPYNANYGRKTKKRQIHKKKKKISSTSDIKHGVVTGDRVNAVKYINKEGYFQYQTNPSKNISRQIMFKSIFGPCQTSTRAAVEAVRTYATVAKTVKGTKGGAKNVSAAASAIPKRNTFKPINSRKTFLVDFYASLMRNNQIVLVCHRNNLLKLDSAHFRQQISALGGQFVVVRNSLLKVYLRSEEEKDPASLEATKRNAQKKSKPHPLSPLLSGPTAIIAFKENDPSKVKKLAKLLQAAKEKLFIVGAKVEQEVFDLQKLEGYKELPSKTELQSQLVGLLNILGGYGLTRTLESASNVLYLTLNSHKENVENPKSEEEAGKAEQATS